MGFSEAVQWWEEWQLRVLVLISLFLQHFLFFAGILRKCSIPSWLRFLIWMAYLGSDAVAIYALATLFNRQKTQEWVSTHQSSASLEMLWASILLIHLGGQDSITAYNIEDNELWRRHVLTAVSQVVVTVYVFFKSWSGHDTDFEALMLFNAGLVKCVSKPWDLKKVSISSLVSSRTEYLHSLSSFGEHYIRDATWYFRGGRGGPLARDEDDDVWKPYDLFVDLTPHYLFRIGRLKAVVNDPEKAHRLVQCGLSVTFDRIYTKKSLLWRNNGERRPATLLRIQFIWLARLGVLISIIMVVSMLDVKHGQGYDSIDRDITFILVALTGVLELILPLVMSGKKIKRFSKGRWPDQVAQHNLFGYLARAKKHRYLRKMAASLGSKDLLDQLWCMKPSKSSRNITKLVHSYLAKGWTERHIKDMASYRAFNDNRGQWTLQREGCGGSLEWSLRRQFDESVLLWHLATEICYFEHVNTGSDATHLSRVMSNYMTYLLFVNTEMLMPGARCVLFREAYRQLNETLKLVPQPDGAAGPSGQDMSPVESDIARMIAQNIHRASGRANFSIVQDACRLAEGLKNLRTGQGNGKMWRVIQGVWVEMLCFSAARCLGYLHAKSLGQGGEFLSYIWLLMNYMGMETVAELMQRAKLQEGGTDNGGDGADGMGVASTAGGNHGDGPTEASPVIPGGGTVDETTAASPVMAATGDDGDGMAATTLPAMPNGDDNA